MDGRFLAADAFSVLIYGVEQSAEKPTGRCWGKMWPPVGVGSVLPRLLRAVQLGTLRSSPKCWLAWQPAAPSASQTCLPSSLPKEPQASTGSAGRGRGVWGGSHGASAAERLVSREFSAFFSRRKKLVGLEMSASESRQCVRAGQWAASWDREALRLRGGIVAGACDWGFVTPILTFT